ncbi:MAG: cytochrome c maturation protein CcmE [Actinomycetota bacterium]
MDPSPRNPSPKRRAKFVIGAAVVACALVGLVGWALNRPQATAFYMTVGEIQAQGATPPGTDLRVNGKVVPGSIERRGLDTTFAIADGGHEIPVTTDQPMPDAFRAGSEVVARGHFDGELFSASEVLAKCPSKFKTA